MSKAVEDAIKAEIKRQDISCWDLGDFGTDAIDHEYLAKAAADAARRELLEALVKYQDKHLASNDMLAWEFGPDEIYEAYPAPEVEDMETPYYVISGNGFDDLLKLIGLDDNP